MFLFFIFMQKICQNYTEKFRHPVQPVYAERTGAGIETPTPRTGQQHQQRTTDIAVHVEQDGLTYLYSSLQQWCTFEPFPWIYILCIFSYITYYIVRNSYYYIIYIFSFRYFVTVIIIMLYIVIVFRCLMENYLWHSHNTGTYRPGHAAADSARVTQLRATKYTTVNWAQFLPVMILHNIQNHPWLILFNETERAQCFHDKKHSFTQRKLVLTKSVSIYYTLYIGIYRNKIYRYYIILYIHVYIITIIYHVF